MPAEAITEHTTCVDGLTAYYRSVPGGAETARPPLLLVHGISCASDMWLPLARCLADCEGAPVAIIPDLPAHGRTGRPPRALDMVELADWCTRLLDHLRMPVVDVAGHSMGCQVALALAHCRPERVRRVALIGPTTGERHVSTLRNAVGLLADSALEPPRYNLSLARLFFRLGPRRYMETVREMQADDAFVHAAALRGPLLVIRGERDAIVPEQVARDLAAAAPMGSYVEIPGAAHAAQYAQPERTTSVMLNFLG